MIVTFVSQCEKKSLKRTRRILDAFANRIGSNVWQTAITEEGLNTVKQLLRKSATKTTAVSCHRIKTRRQTELVWIVGNKRKFNEVGIVPVNWTTKELFMDIVSNKTSHILANTNKQPLYQHLFAVGYLAYHLIEHMNINSKSLKLSAFIAGILHDIGKVDPLFQIWVNKKINKIQDEPVPEDGQHIDKTVTGMTKFTFDKHPRHHELSWLFASSMLRDNSTLNKLQQSQIMHGIYWHHTKPYRKKNNEYFNKAKGIYKKFTESLEKTTSNLNNVIVDINSVIQEVIKLAKHYNKADMIPPLLNDFSLTTDDLPKYKNYSDINDQMSEYISEVRENALNNLIRTAVISADRLVSQLDAEDLASYLQEATLLDLLDSITLEDNDLTQNIQNCINGFDNNSSEIERTQAQKATAVKLANLQKIAKSNESDNVVVLQGPAGCGKTKIVLEWALNTQAKKIIWVCPRVQVCLGIINDLTQPEYLPQSRIEIFTGEYKKILTHGLSLEDTPNTEIEDYFSGDIVITTIDQVLSAIITHNKVDTLIPFMQSHVIFDEFHELILMPAFNLLFAELINAKKMQGHVANTLLVSATPNYYFTKQFLKIKAEDHISIESFNNSDYQIEIQTYDSENEPNPLISHCHTDDISTFIITNTAISSQLSFIKHHQSENSILLHSKYNKRDKSYWFDKVFDTFKRNGTQEYNVLRSGPIVQASLNISCDRMYTELTNAENWLQRLGRLDRFGKNVDSNIYTTVMANNAITGKQTNQTAKFLNKLYSWYSTVAWINFLQERILEQPTFKLNELYSIYRDFYQDPTCLAKIEEDFLRSLKQSSTVINSKILDPIYIPFKSPKNTDTVKTAKTSLRGDSRFVQMATCYIDTNQQVNFSNDYLYDELNPTENTIFTESVLKIQGYGDSSKNLVIFMHAKHHNIKEGYKKAYKDFELLNEARTSTNPIYLSYTPIDLKKINSATHPYSIYYVFTNKQPVGSMRLDKLVGSNR
ncbi:CRISPR-associated endonuclease Cas3'' [Psychrobacter sp. I-STPA6b]|uniref:CRISPR-associated endonuclease Cas3'' n=1 Tax=Psychrobacter sp. I-STPA6b TaxID=2585718 RepID=UPI001D0C745B|nr:CRISPR-associated endonuclease Cas3'' [Psychrobacter sp. I-STPA6b]